MFKASILYGHPSDPEAFEKYYAETHLPLAYKIPGVAKLELTRFSSAADGSKAAFYRQADLFFTSREQIQQSLGSPEGQDAAADLAHFATGGVTLLIGETEK